MVANGPMTRSTNNIWAPAADFPTEPAFYRQVLGQVPTPIIVVDELGLIVYGNEAMIELGQWSKEEGIDASLLSYVHPDDIEWVAESFSALTSGEPEQATERAWSSIPLRLVAQNGDVVPVEVTGFDRLDHQHVGGVIYHVRPMVEQSIERRVIAGMVNGDRAELLADVVELVSLPPLDLSCCLTADSVDGMVELLAASGHGLISILDAPAHVAGMPSIVGDEPVEMFDVATCTEPLRTALRDAGFVGSWHAPVASDTNARLVAFSTRRHTSTAGIVSRLSIAASLAAAVLNRRDR